MKKFNRICLNTGRIRGSVTTKNQEEAIKYFDDQNLDVIDDYFVESADETEKHRALQTRLYYTS